MQMVDSLEMSNYVVRYMATRLLGAATVSSANHRDRSKYIVVMASEACNSVAFVTAAPAQAGNKNGRKFMFYLEEWQSSTLTGFHGSSSIYGGAIKMNKRQALEFVEELMKHNTKGDIYHYVAAVRVDHLHKYIIALNNLHAVSS